MSGKASPQSLLQGIKKTKSGRATTSRYGAEEVGGGGGGGGDAGRGGGRGGRLPRSDRGGTLHLHYAWYLFFNMLLNCLPFSITGGRGRGRGRGRGTVLLSDILSTSGDVASQTAFSESPDEEIDSRDLEAESRDEEMVTASGPSSASTKKAKVRGETEVPKEEPAPEARTLIELSKWL